MTVLLPMAGTAAAALAAGLGGHPAVAARAQFNGGVARTEARVAATPAPGDGAAPPLAGPPAAAPEPAQPENATAAPSHPLSTSTWTEPPAASATGPEGPTTASRPRLSAAAAMGASVDASSSSSGKAFVSPSFAGELGFGDGPLGFHLRLLSSQASGRAVDAPPDRLAVDLMLAVRPWAARARDDARWGARVRRSIAIDVGLAGERLGAGPVHAYRAGLVVGVRTDFPLTGLSGEPGELRVRLALRRLLAGEVTVGTMKSGDSTEALAGLVAVF